MSDVEKDKSTDSKKKEESGFQALPLILFIGPFIGLIIYKIFFDS